MQREVVFPGKNKAKQNKKTEHAKAWKSEIAIVLKAWLRYSHLF